MKNLKIYEAFNYSLQGSGKISPEEILKRGLTEVIMNNFFLDVWFSTYNKIQSGDPEFDYTEEANRFEMDGHMDEIIPEEDYSEIGEDGDTFPTAAMYWAKTLNYILDNQPNPMEDEALDMAIQKALR